MKKKNKSRGFTFFLWIILFVLIGVLWSLFISGPNRVYELNNGLKIEKIEKSVKGIEGLTRHQFDYVTYQGYTDSTLYWFDANGKKITDRDIDTLDYEAAKKKAKSKYGVSCDTIQLGYGYNNPVYEIRNKKKLILLDYDSLERVYEREV